MAIRIIDKLNDLDFSAGIKAQYINENFDLVRRWIEAERLRIGGWGLVEGFELSRDLSDFTVHVTKGMLINEDGEEVHVDEHTFQVGPPVYKDMVEELTVSAEGVITLSFAPYSNIQKHTIIYNPPEYSELSSDEFNIINLDTGSHLTTKDIRFIDENICIVNNELAGAKVKVTYLYANDRIDGILLKKDGSEYIYEIGIISTSPTQQVIQDYLKNGYYLIGFAYWHIGKEIDVQFITTDRNFRPIFVDEDNNLYLNGVLYTGNKFIYFVEPEYPKENDLWYDTENEILYIWRPNENGEYEWKAINDLSRFSREYGYFSEAENPDDLQTFTFEEKPNLRFVPGQNSLTIVIDQVLVMRDQFTELYEQSTYDDNAVTGYGFKLNNPLERPSIVEVYVDHSVNVKNQEKELFLHTAGFIDSGSFSVTDENTTDFTCTGDYEINEKQLEVWLNGVRLIFPDQYCELTRNNETTTVEDYQTLTNKFRVLVALKPEDVVSYKITRLMSTYDNLRVVTDALNDKVDSAVKNLDNTRLELDTVIDNVNNTLEEITDANTKLAEEVTRISNDMVSKSEGVSIDDLQDEIKDNLTDGTIYFVQNANSSLITMRTLKEEDYLSIFWIQDLTRLILIRDEDYTVSPSANGGIDIELDPKWIADDARIYIEGISLGK